MLFDISFLEKFKQRLSIGLISNRIKWCLLKDLKELLFLFKFNFIFCLKWLNLLKFLIRIDRSFLFNLGLLIRVTLLFRIRIATLLLFVAIMLVNFFLCMFVFMFFCFVILTLLTYTPKIHLILKIISIEIRVLILIKYWLLLKFWLILRMIKFTRKTIFTIRSKFTNF